MKSFYFIFLVKFELFLTIVLMKYQNMIFMQNKQKSIKWKLKEKLSNKIILNSQFDKPMSFWNLLHQSTFYSTSFAWSWIFFASFFIELSRRWARKVTDKKDGV